jgi:hypothetical protein
VCKFLLLLECVPLLRCVPSLECVLLPGIAPSAARPVGGDRPSKSVQVGGGAGAAAPARVGGGGRGGSEAQDGGRGGGGGGGGVGNAERMDMAEVTDRDLTQLAPHWSAQIDPETGVEA